MLQCIFKQAPLNGGPELSGIPELGL